MDTADMPALVAPVPRYAGAQPLSEYSSNRSGQSGQYATQGVQTEQVEQDVNGQPSRSDYTSILPAQGLSHEAQGALEKLDRMKRNREHKRRWRTRTGIAGLAHISTVRETKCEAVGKPKDADGDDGDSIASSLNLYGEVRLAITNMPGFTVLASKARQGLSALDRADSPGPDAVGTQDDGSIRNSLPFRFGTGRRRSSLVPSSEQAIQSGAIIQAQTDGIPVIPSTSADALPANVARPVAANPELDPLKEERRIEEATDALISDGPSAAPHAVQPVRPKAQRPRLMIHSPTQTDEHPSTSMMQSPEDMVAPPNALTSMLRDGTQNGREPLPNGQSPSPGPCDAYAITAAEQCQKNLSRQTLLEETAIDDLATSIGSPSSMGSGSESDTDDSSDPDEVEQQLSSLSLQHSTQLTRREKKKLLRRLRRDQRKRIVQDGKADVPERASSPASKVHRRTASLTNHISTGLHYASSQSRNRRAMEKYSPHPSRPNSTKPFQPGSAFGMTAMGTPPFEPTATNGTVSRSSTPANALGSERSSLSNDDGARETAGAGVDSIPASVKAGTQSDENDEEAWRSNDISRNLLRRWGTGQSTASSIGPSGSVKGPSFKSRFLSLRRGNRQQPSDVAEEEHDATPRHEHDAEKELDKALGRLVAQEAPEELEEQYEYDVLYENQRGMLVFGIPKFSAKTLFQWDPAPWTNARSGNSAYNVVNAQLPNPSWEWVHPEWMIDMSGDVDEAGWQYSYNFGRLAVPLFVRPAQIIPQANAEGNKITNERFKKAMERAEKREEKQADRDDDGFEALKRSAISRQAKWSGIPTQNKYVRRRRWIRLRRRKPIDVAQNNATPKAGTPLGLSKGSADWSQLHRPSSAKEKKANEAVAASDNDDDGSMSDFEEGSSSSSLDEVANAGESAFLPRRVYGDLKSGRDPLEVRATKEHMRRRRHAREFTGTIRELKSLLPTILDRRGGRSHRLAKTANERQKSLWLMEIDARNPFISWSYVKRRLEDDDLAFATTTLRARERRHAQKSLQRRSRPTSKEGDSSILGPGPSWEQYELTKDALVEINFRRVLRVLKACKIDRQKLQLWRVWLSLEQLGTNVETSRNEDLIELGLATSSAAASESLLHAKEDLAKLAKTRWRTAYTPADPLDVWDVVERCLDRLLLTFEYQSSRASFLRLLLTIHATSHAAHRFRPAHWRMGGGAAPGADPAVEPDAPAVLSPTTTYEIAAGDEWRAARVPRLEFWSDLIDCARSLLSSGAAVPAATARPQSSLADPNSNPASPQMRSTLDLHPSTNPSSRSRTPVLMPGLSFAMVPISRSNTPQPATGSPLTNASDSRRRSIPNAGSPPTSILLSGTRGGSTAASLSASATLARTSSPKPYLPRINGSAVHPGSPDFGLNPPPQLRRPHTGSPSELTESDQTFLAQLLQLPLARQRDVLLQSRESAFDSKPKAQTSEVHLPYEEVPSAKHPAKSLSLPMPSSHSDQSAHERTDSDVVQRLSRAVGDD